MLLTIERMYVYKKCNFAYENMLAIKFYINFYYYIREECKFV